MPCEEITVSAPMEPRFNVTSMDVSGSRREIAVEFDVTNTGDGSGSGQAVLTIDVGMTGQTDREEGYSFSLQPGQTRTFAELFQIDVDSDTDTEVCVSV